MHREDTASDDAEPPRPASVFSQISLNDPQIRALRAAVIVMGVLIVMGLVAVIGRIVYLMARSPAQPSHATADLRSEVVAQLPAGANVRNISLQGDRLAIHYDGTSGAGIIVVDLATGRPLSRVNLVPQPPRP